MAVSEVEMLEIISEVLLVDSASETPEIKQDLKNVTQHQLTNLIINLANSYHDSDVGINLAPYKATVQELQAMKSDSDFDKLMSEFFAAYPE